MTLSKTIILIDGQNLYYSLKDLKLKEISINWDMFFQKTIEPGDIIHRTYWFRPDKVLDTYYKEENLIFNVIKHDHRSYLNQYLTNKIIPKQIESNVKQKVNDMLDWIAETKKQFDRIQYNYDSLCMKYKNIEMVKSGVLKIDPYNMRKVGEKGVDVSLAVMLVKLSIEKACDKIILVSGDYDYCQALQYAKDKMMHVHIVKIHKGRPPRNKSVSRELAVIADKVVDIYETDIQSGCLID